MVYFYFFWKVHKWTSSFFSLSFLKIFFTGGGGRRSANNGKEVTCSFLSPVNHDGCIRAIFSETDFLESTCKWTSLFFTGEVGGASNGK